MLQLVRRLDRWMVALEKAVAGSLVLAVFVVVLLQVIMRYLFERPNPWSEELSRFCFIWLSMIGASLALESQSHFAFDLAVTKLPRRPRILGLPLRHRHRCGRGFRPHHPGLGTCASGPRPAFSGVASAACVGIRLGAVGRDSHAVTFGGRSRRYTSRAGGEESVIAVLLLVAFIVLVLLSIPIGFALVGTAAFAFVLDEELPLVIIPQQIVAGMDSLSHAGGPPVHSRRLHHGYRGHQPTIGDVGLLLGGPFSWRTRAGGGHSGDILCRCFWVHLGTSGGDWRHHDPPARRKGIRPCTCHRYRRRRVCHGHS